MSEPATKGDIAQLRGDLATTKTELTSEIDSLRREFRHQGVLFEQLGTKVQVLAEGLVGMREHFTAEIRALRQDLSSRIAVVEEVVRHNSGDLQDVKADVADLRRRFDRLERESDLEKRVAEVEKRLGIR